MASSSEAINLPAGSFETSLAYRYIHSDEVYAGSHKQPSSASTGPRLTVHSLDVSLRYGITRRLSTTLIVPLIRSRLSTIHPDGFRHSIDTGAEVGDLRLLVNYWILDPDVHSTGNLALSLGVKAPTGDEDLEGTFRTSTGNQRRVLDVSQQPGEGKWGVIVEMLSFMQVYKCVSVYASGSYLFNPSNTNSTTPPQSSPSQPFKNSVPDQYSARLGLSFAVWPSAGLSLSAGARMDGIPRHDVFGGSDGFRRPGRVIYLEPALIWTLSTKERTIGTLFFSVPMAIDRRIWTSDLDEDRGVRTRGGLAPYQIQLAYSLRF